MNHPVRSRSTLTTLVAAAVIASGNAVAHDAGGDSSNTAFYADALTQPQHDLRQISADTLKREYMKCDRAAALTRLDLPTAAACVMVHDELRDRVFGGSFDDLVAWWRVAVGAAAQSAR